MKGKPIKFLLPFILLFACLFASCKGAPNTLSAPVNLRIEDCVLCWDGVEYADGYSVYVDGKEYETAEQRFSLDYLDKTKIYPIEVMAYSNTAGINHSGYAEITYTGKYAVPTEGLELTLIRSSEDSDELAVTKFAADANGVCVIPAFYNDMRVVSLSPASDDPAVAEIKDMYLPNTMNGEIFRTDAFSRFPNLKEIELEKGSVRYESRGNCIIDQKEKKVAVGCVNSVISDSVAVTKIGEGAYSGRNMQTVLIPRQITVIESYAFSNCPLEAVYYDGTAEEWANISVDEEGNGTFLTKICFYSENEPIESGGYWRYVNGIPTKW